MTEFYKALKELGKVFGIEESYTDNWGRSFLTRPEIAREILALKGMNLDTERMSLDSQVSVINASQPPEFINVMLDINWGRLQSCCATGTISIREAKDRAPAAVWRLDDPCLCVCTDEETGLTSVSIPTPELTDLGLFRFKISCEIDSKLIKVELALLVCPDSAYLPKQLIEGKRVAGVGVAVYGLKSARNWGIGDFTDLRDFTDWARSELGAHIVGINPLHATFNRNPFNTSPYMPSSRLYRNHIYLDVTNVSGYRESDKAMRFVHSIETQALDRKSVV